MTREETKSFYSELCSEFDAVKSTVYSVVDKIYDDFESRTCKNCKHFQVYDDSKMLGECINKESIAFTSCEAIYGDDGCNKFERKDK